LNKIVKKKKKSSDACSLWPYVTRVKKKNLPFTLLFGHILSILNLISKIVLVYRSLQPVPGKSLQLPTRVGTLTSSSRPESVPLLKI